MHQQVRTSTTLREGPGADTAQGGIVQLLTVLRDGGVNMQAASGTNLNRGGEFVFSVHHGDEDPDGPTREAVALLERHGYRPYVIEPHVCEVEDQPGGLLGCIQEIEAEGDEIVEIHVGTGSPVPIQIVTRRHLEGSKGGSETAY